MKGLLRALFVSLSYSSFCGLGHADTSQLRSLVDQWVSVMEKTHEESSRWTREKEVLESAKAGLVTEIEDLKAKIAEAKILEQSASKEDQEKIAQKRAFDSAREDLAKGLSEVMPMMSEVIALIPETYMAENTKLAGAVSAFNDLKDAPEEKSLGKKLNAIVSILGELETFNSKIWTVQETRVVAGDERIVTTAYLGLGAAYSADDNGKVALKGMPSDEGWVFTEVKDQSTAKEINKLIITATNAGEIELSQLPVALK